MAFADAATATTGFARRRIWHDYGLVLALEELGKDLTNDDKDRYDGDGIADIGDLSAVKEAVTEAAEQIKMDAADLPHVEYDDLVEDASHLLNEDDLLRFAVGRAQTTETSQAQWDSTTSFMLEADPMVVLHFIRQSWRHALAHQYKMYRDKLIDSDHWFLILHFLRIFNTLKRIGYTEKRHDESRTIAENAQANDGIPLYEKFLEKAPEMNGYIPEGFIETDSIKEVLQAMQDAENKLQTIRNLMHERLPEPTER